MTIAAFRGTCPTCGHDHDADNAEFRRLLKASSPESPAKEQLWEQFAAPQDSEAGANRPGNSLSGLPAVAAPDMAAMARRLREWGQHYGGRVQDDLDAAAAMIEKLGQGWIPVSKERVDRFLNWPLPDSVCSDECVTKRDWGKEQGWPKRVGTNLLTADEARQMLEYVLRGETK